MRVRGLTLDTGRDRTAVLQNGCNICHFFAARGILLVVKYFVVRVGCRLMVARKRSVGLKDHRSCRILPRECVVSLELSFHVRTRYAGEVVRGDLQAM